MKTTSCGILVLGPGPRLLLGHATGTPWWDIPKGGREPGETTLEAALRETEEETGLVLAASQVRELGLFPYRRTKNLHLFAAAPALGDAFADVSSLRCRSTYQDRRGRTVPEMDAFAWVPFEEVPRRCAPALARLLTGRVDLQAVEQLLRPPTPTSQGGEEFAD